MRRDGGDQGNKELLPPVAKFVLISLLEKCNAKHDGRDKSRATRRALASTGIRVSHGRYYA